VRGEPSPSQLAQAGAAGLLCAVAGDGDTLLAVAQYLGRKPAFAFGSGGLPDLGLLGSPFCAFARAGACAMAYPGSHHRGLCGQSVLGIVGTTLPWFGLICCQCTRALT